MHLRPPFPARTLLGLIVPALFAWQTGCATKNSLSVVAVDNPAVEARQTFILVNGNEDEDDDGLIFQEMAAIIKPELTARGMYEAPHRESADIIVRVETRVDGFYKWIDVLETKHSSPTAPGSESALIISDTKKTIRIQAYKTTLVLTATANAAAPGDDPVVVWKVEAASESEKVDVRAALPELAAVAAAYIGEETEGARTLAASSPTTTARRVPNLSRLISR